MNQELVQLSSRVNGFINEPPTNDFTNIAVENIYGIPSDNEKMLMQTKVFAKARATKLQKKKESLKDNFNTYSKTLKKDDLDKALKLKDELIEVDNVQREEFDKLKVNTNALFKKQFAFPEVAKNDFSTELFDELEIAEKNFNANMDNSDLLATFVDTANKVKTQLKDKYSDQWTDPAEGPPNKVTEDE